MGDYRHDVVEARGIGAGAVVSAVASVPLWGWFLLILAGGGGFLLIGNELAYARFRRQQEETVRRRLSGHRD